MTIRLHELAKLLGRPSKELMDQAKVLGIPCRSHQSVLEDDEAVQLKNAVASLPKPKPKAIKKPAIKKPVVKEKEAEPEVEVVEKPVEPAPKPVAKKLAKPKAAVAAVPPSVSSEPKPEPKVEAKAVPAPAAPVEEPAPAPAEPVAVEPEPQAAEPVEPVAEAKPAAPAKSEAPKPPAVTRRIESAKVTGSAAVGRIELPRPGVRPPLRHMPSRPVPPPRSGSSSTSGAPAAHPAAHPAHPAHPASSDRPSRPAPVPLAQRPLTPRRPQTSSGGGGQGAKILYRPGDKDGPPEKPQKKRPTPTPLARIRIEPEEDPLASKLKKAVVKKGTGDQAWKGQVDEEGDVPTRVRTAFRRRPVKPPPVVAKIMPKPTQVELITPVTVKDLSSGTGVKASVIINKLMVMGVLANINQQLDDAVVELLSGELGVKVTLKKPKDVTADIIAHRNIEETAEDQVTRAPVVTFMGHVDHGKTSLLDAIRKANVVATEAGGITQHIGAYKVTTSQGKSVVFLDTPGHMAFTEMRARGANVTDVAVIVVAADDGVMPQTEEAINHAKEAKVPIVVALNKIDLPQANPDKVKQQLASLDLIWDKWGGKTVIVPCSATKKTGLDELVDMLSLEAELLELKANPKRPAEGVVIEARQSEGRGVTTTVLVRNGTLRIGDIVLVGRAYGRVRAMYDDKGVELLEAGPSTPVSVTGLSVVPEAGDPVYVVGDIAEAKVVAEDRERRMRAESLGTRKGIKLEDFFEFVQQSKVKELRVIVKADVKGSLEVLKKTIEDVHSPEVRIRILHSAVGGVNESDVLLASASDAVVIGFHVAPEEKARQLAEAKGVDVRIYQIIYQVGDEMRKAVEGMLSPEKKEMVDGHVDIREVFKVSRIGTIAGCYVTDGVVTRQNRVRIVRDGGVVFDGRIETLKRFKDDVREVRAGFECGLKIAGYDDVKVGDRLESYHVEEFARKL